MKNVGQTLSFDYKIDVLADVQRPELLITLLEHNPQDDTPVVTAAPKAN